MFGALAIGFALRIPLESRAYHKFVRLIVGSAKHARHGAAEIPPIT